MIQPSHLNNEIMIYTNNNLIGFPTLSKPATNHKTPLNSQRSYLHKPTIASIPKKMNLTQ